MRALILVCVIATSCGLALAKGGAHSVKGHTTKDGTYVAPHQQTNPNGSKTDNWSSKPNVNPHTGKPGTVDPLKPSTPKK